MRYCKNCGLLAPFDTDHCPQCGAPLPPESPAPASARPEKTPRYEAEPRETVPALSEWATLGTLLLFSIPVVGFILSLAWSFFGSHPARQRLAQAWLIRTMIVLGVVALICLWLGLNSVLSLSAPHYYYAF